MTTSTDGLQRRTVLAGALAGSAVLAVPVLEPTLAAAAAVAGPGVNGLGAQSAARLVHGANGSAVQVPAELGALLTVGASGVAAGTALTITYDNRLYSAAPSAVLVSGERVIPVLVHPASSSAASGQLELRLPELPAGSYTVRAGGLVRDRYPADLITNPLPTTAKVSEPSGTVTAQTLSKPAPKGLPWGVQLGAGWLQAGWADQYYAWHPATVTVYSVGPGAIPAGSRIRVTLDGAVFESVKVSAASDSLGHKVNGLPRRTEVVGRPVATWTAPAAIPAGARITLTCTTVARKLSGALDWVEPPLVDFLPPKAGRDAQRLTTQESLTRMDDVYSAATRARFGPVS